MEDIKKGQIRSLVGGVYDIQKLRIATGNRIVASMRPDLVKSLSDAEGVEEVHVLKDILAEYRNITDYFVNTCNSKGSIEKAINSVTPTPDYVKTKVEYALVQSYERLVDAEAGLNRAVTVYVKQHPMWGLFFEGVKGCGPMMAAVCIAYLDPYQARHCSSFWKYCGLDVVTNDKGEPMLKHAWLGDASPVEVREAECVGGPLAILDSYYGKYVTCPDDAQYRLDWIKNVYTPDMNTKYVFPNVFMSSDDTKQIANLNPDIYKCVNAAKADWIMNGFTDADWDKLQSDLQAYKLNDYLAIFQKYLDAYYGK